MSSVQLQAIRVFFEQDMATWDTRDGVEVEVEVIQDLDCDFRAVLLSPALASHTSCRLPAMPQSFSTSINLTDYTAFHKNKPVNASGLPTPWHPLSPVHPALIAPTGTTCFAIQPFHVTEVCKRILLLLDPRDIPRTNRVCKQLRNVFLGSQKLRRHVFILVEPATTSWKIDLAEYTITPLSGAAYEAPP
ncbi:hypothetical protein EJ03DRAFT_378511 [Teratosphaeria nubilosa]|uniref:F-box domain-containing protein n=1 Tax=Teratosphaeria nubilosa TaxID=161662 RepID=A0A6G1KWC0_9PEZI|nr:hypothetical protein EJ03DRAFT_378511 [Teratosphaeria nubilosa]